MTAPQDIKEPGLTIAYNPATGEEIGQVPNTDLNKLPDIFSHARAAQKIWARRSFKERARALRLMRDYIVANAEELSEVVSKSNGKTLVDALATEVLPCTLACDWYAKHAEKVLKEKKLPIDSPLFIKKRMVINLCSYFLLSLSLWI
jgi:succinate-semialdehyde dehydrogenase/glutarate-semialdehyde dehydrogenase